MLRKILEAQDRNGGLGAMLKTILEAAEFLLFFWWSYLPIIVECCWTAASRSLSSIVHSPISEHPEKTKAQRHSVQIPPKRKRRVSSSPTSVRVWPFSVSKTSRVWQKRHPPRDAAAASSSLRASARCLRGGALSAQSQRESCCVCWALPRRCHTFPCHGNLKSWLP